MILKESAFFKGGPPLFPKHRCPKSNDSVCTIKGAVHNPSGIRQKTCPAF